MDTAARDDGYCELSFPSNASVIATVRRFVGDFYQRILGDAEVRSRLVVATHELLGRAEADTVTDLGVCLARLHTTATASAGFAVDVVRVEAA